MRNKLVGKRGEKRVSEPNLTDLKGEVAVVTGGRGNLGKEFVRVLRAHGAKVASLDITQTTKNVAHEYICDITNRDTVRKTYAAICKQLGTPTILVNCAGVDSPPGKKTNDTGNFEDVSEAFWDAVIDSHLKGAFLMSQEFVRAIRSKKKDHASIINVSSTYGIVSPDQSVYNFLRKEGNVFYKPVAYSVAKSGMLNLTRWLAEYGAQFHIRANTLVLGGVYNNQPDAFLKEYEKRTPLGRMARIDEYNGAVVFLASEAASSYVTGSMLIADGGYTAR